MVLLIVGLVLWTFVHFLKRLAPTVRANMDTKLGTGPAKGTIALLLVFSLLFMIFGYRSADTLPAYTPLAGMGHLNNLLMFLAVLLFGMGSSKGKMRSWFRHPMLMGVVTWAIAHLLVNGDLASLILFGGLAIWALIQMVLVNRAVPNWTRPEPGPVARDIRLLVIAAVLYAIIATIHVALGYNPFLGTYG